MYLSLFDKDYFSQPANRCEVYHFHIYIENNIDWPFEKNNARIKGVFMHEYIHYIQHLSTLCGISLSRQCNLLFCNYRAYFADKETIPVPLTIQMVAPRMIPFFDYFDKVKGNREYQNRIDEIRVSEQEIKRAYKEKRSIKLDTFNLETNQWTEGELSFGYYAIIESMADMVQRIYDPDVFHADVPYHVVKKLCETYYPEVVNDFRKMISLCICALMSSNPAYGFFEAIEFAKAHPDMDGVSLYREYINTSVVQLINGKKISIADFFEHQLNEYDKTVEQALGCADYYREAFASALECAKTGDNLLLILLYDNNVGPNQFFQYLANFYGSPYIEAYNQSLFPGRMRMPQDVVAALGLEMLYKSISNIETTNCPRMEQCKRLNNYSYNCINGNQWSRIEMCPFKAALHYFRLEGKSFETHAS